MSTRRQKIQLELAFPVRSPGEPVGRTDEGPEVPVAKQRTESPARSEQTESLMEVILERENLKKALHRVQANKGAPGIDGITVDELLDYLREHWPTMRGELLAGTYKPRPDKRVLKLIRAFLRAGVVIGNGLVSPTAMGTPQGGPLSPLLSNLVLDELDKELERRGHRFCRYADDVNIYVRSLRAGERVMDSINSFITQRLKLRVNASKSKVAPAWQCEFLGFSISRGPARKRCVGAKAVARFKDRVRDLTRRSRGVSIHRIVYELNRYLRGWRGYFGFADARGALWNGALRRHPPRRPPLAHAGTGPRVECRRCVRRSRMSTSTRLGSVGCLPDALNQPNRLGTDPYAGWYGRAEVARPPPIPID